MLMYLHAPTLTPAGAQRLRQVRDDLLAHPGGFDMRCWSSCIKGRMDRIADAQRPWWQWWRRANEAARLLGYTSFYQCDLFMQYHLAEAQDVAAAATRINAFLTRQGYALTGEPT